MNTKNENALLDLVSKTIGARNDAQLSRALEVAPPVISKIRHNRLPVGALLIIKIHEITDMPVAEIKSYITHGPQQVARDEDDEIDPTAKVHPNKSQVEASVIEKLGRGNY